MRQCDPRGTEHSNLAERRSARQGFTIVELLIVIVVIGILAAIALVAYNGIQNRARASAASSALSQAAKKLSLFTVDSGGSYPTDSTAFFAEIGASASGVKGDVSYQYAVNNSADPKTYCVTATVGNVSYRLGQSGTPTAGGCPGHGQGGSVAITNFVRSPTFAAGALGVSAPTAGGQTSNNSVRPNGGPSDRPHYRRAFTASSTGVGNGLDVILVAYTGVGVTAATPGQTFTASAQVRSSRSQVVRLQLQWLNSAAGSSGVSNGDDISLTAGTWTQLTVSGAAPTNTIGVRFDLDTGGGSSQWASGDTLDYTMLMLTEGASIYSFADGNSPDWLWNGTPNSSTSTGPAP